MTIVIVIFFRLTLPLLILRWPLFGGIVAMVADFLDYGFFSHFGWSILGGPGMRYELLDKTLDTYYLVLEVYAVRLWQSPLYKITALALFIWRFVGYAVFMFVQNEVVLIIFPNVFETFFLVTLVFNFYKQKTAEVDIYLAVMGFCFIQKLLQEYALHVQVINWSLLFS